jgi:hypothetical protein
VIGRGRTCRLRTRRHTPFVFSRRMHSHEMNALIAVELASTPRCTRPQNLYRMAYEQTQLNCLGGRAQVGPPPDGAHVLALRVVRDYHPDFVPERHQ